MPQDIVREKVLGAIRQALRHARSKGLLQAEPPAVLTLDPPKRPEWGDLSSTVAMSLAASERRSPQDVAEIILAHLEQRDQLFDRVEIARPGFLNMTVRRDLWLQVLGDIEARGSSYGTTDLGMGRRVLVEFVSANPTGPLHVGHGRGAAVGHAIANLLQAAGHEVVREYYINDAGRQMKLLGQSVWAKYRALQGVEADVPEDGYRGTYIEAVAARLSDEVGARLLAVSPEEAESRCRDFAYRELLGRIRSDLDAFGITFDSWFSEAALIGAGAVEQALDDLTRQGLLFEEEGALWFKSSAFGDEKDRVVRKQEGDYTYLASDIAYHRDKLRRGYDVLIDVWGADHHGYIARMQGAVQAYGHPKDRLRVVLVQMVNLLRDGRKVEMSKRAGEFVTLREVIDEVGADAGKFFFLMRRSDSHLDFDLGLAKQRSAENPVYYVQYAHARIASLFRVAEERGIPVPRPSEADLGALTGSEDLTLIRKLADYPTVLAGSAAALEPHRLTFYLQELAAQLHTYYYRNRILPALGGEEDGEGEPPVLTVEPQGERRREPLTPQMTAGRLALMWCVQQVLRNALAILGVSAPDRM